MILCSCAQLLHFWLLYLLPTLLSSTRLGGCSQSIIVSFLHSFLLTLCHCSNMGPPWAAVPSGNICLLHHLFHVLQRNLCFSIWSIWSNSTTTATFLFFHLGVCKIVPNTFFSPSSFLISICPFLQFTWSDATMAEGLS